MPAQPAPSSSVTPPNPPIDYVVAVWLGMPDEEVARGLREGWIRAPQGAAVPADPAAALLTDATSEPAFDSPVDRERVRSLVRRLDRSLDDATFDAAWSEAAGDDAGRVQRFARFLAGTLGVTATEATDFAVLERAAEGASGDARFVRLAERSGGELEALARSDGGVRRALFEHSAWAFTGDGRLANAADPMGRFDRFDRNSGEALLTDAWITDRSRHAAWRAAADRGRPLEVAGDGWRFVDRRDAASDVEIKGSTAPIHQVIFARDGGDHVTGGATTDRIHGGDGDDVLLGRAGEDLLEGGRGGDVLYGGGERDDLSGQQGDDELDGGGGNDRVDGGSGDDDLAGGRGDDLLHGGAGRDRYRFSAGDGHDTIEDADGGEIVIDDVALQGSMQRDADGWTSVDGRLLFTLDGSPERGGKLTIRRADQSNAGDALEIAGWRQDAFGFALAADNAGAPLPEESGSGPDARHQRSADPFGNEGSTGIPADFADAVDGGTADAATDEATAADVDAFVGDPQPANTPLVDLATYAHALDGWNVAAPPDVGALQLVDARTVTASTLADALAGDDAGFGDADELAMSSTDWQPLQLPNLSDPSLPLPPALMLRHSS